MSAFPQVLSDLNAKLPDNTQELISPADVREPLVALVIAIIALEARVEELEDD